MMIDVALTWPLTARGALFERLGRAYVEADTGGVVLTGPAGVGKTRLGEELLPRRHHPADGTRRRAPGDRVDPPRSARPSLATDADQRPGHRRRRSLGDVPSSPPAPRRPLRR